MEFTFAKEPGDRKGLGHTFLHYSWGLAKESKYNLMAVALAMSFF